MAAATLRALMLWFLRIGLAVVFIYAGIIKALNPTAFLANIESYRILPYTVTGHCLLSAISGDCSWSCAATSWIQQGRRLVTGRADGFVHCRNSPSLVAWAEY